MDIRDDEERIDALGINPDLVHDPDKELLLPEFLTRFRANEATLTRTGEDAERYEALEGKLVALAERFRAERAEVNAQYAATYRRWAALEAELDTWLSRALPWWNERRKQEGGPTALTWDLTAAGPTFKLGLDLPELYRRCLELDPDLPLSFWQLDEDQGYALDFEARNCCHGGRDHLLHLSDRLVYTYVGLDEGYCLGLDSLDPEDVRRVGRLDRRLGGVLADALRRHAAYLRDTDVNYEEWAATQETLAARLDAAG